MQISKSILQKRLQKVRHEEEIERIREKHGNMAASMTGDFSNCYTSKYPDDFDCIGTITDPKEWARMTMPGDATHPIINPVWDFNMPEDQRPISCNDDEYLFMLIKMESENGWKSKANQYSVIFSPIDELFTLGKASEQIPELDEGFDNDIELFIPGERVGFVKYPTSRNYDLWMFLSPSQTSIDLMEKCYEIWESY